MEAGECSVYQRGFEDTPLLDLKVGSYFGELALLHDDRRAANVKAVTDVTLLVLTRKEFKELLGPLFPAMEAHAGSYKLSRKGFSRRGKVRLQRVNINVSY